MILSFSWQQSQQPSSRPRMTLRTSPKAGTLRIGSCSPGTLAYSAGTMGRAISTATGAGLARWSPSISLEDRRRSSQRPCCGLAEIRWARSALSWCSQSRWPSLSKSWRTSGTRHWVPSTAVAAIRRQRAAGVRAVDGAAAPRFAPSAARTHSRPGHAIAGTASDAADAVDAADAIHSAAATT